MISFNVYLRAVGKLAVAAAVCGAIAAFQYAPRRLHQSQAAAAVGGCGSGLCTGQQNNPCMYAGSACGDYAQCAASNSGAFICTPQSYCQDAGCGGEIDGGTCH